MKFSCDSCHAQYMISDEKVGAAGVRVRCKKCGNVIHVKRVEEEAPPQEDATVVMTADKLAQIRDQLDAARGIGPDAVTSPPKVTADEIGKAFDSMFSDRTADDGAVQPPEAAAAAAPPVAPPVRQDEDPDRAETRVLTAGDMQRISPDFAAPPPPAVFETENTVAAPYTARPASGPGLPVEWFVAIRDEQVGPLTPEGVKARWDGGEVGPDTLVWCSGLPDWKPLSSVDELAHLVAPAPTATVRNGVGRAGPELAIQGPWGAIARRIQAGGLARRVQALRRLDARLTRLDGPRGDGGGRACQGRAEASRTRTGACPGAPIVALPSQSLRGPPTAPGRCIGSLPRRRDRCQLLRCACAAA